MKLKIPYLVATLCATASLFHLADTQGLGAASLVTLQTTAGQNIDLASPDGKTRLVSFWSPDCPISERDIPGFSQLQEQFSEQPFEIVAIAMPYSDSEEVTKYVGKNDIRYSIAHDTDGSASRAFPGVRFTPTTFLVDSNGKIVWRHVGKLNATKAAGQITELMQPKTLANNL